LGCKEDWERFVYDLVARELDSSVETIRRDYSFSSLSMLGGQTMLGGQMLWTREMDLHMLIGFSIFGIDIKALDFIASDPRFCFANILGKEKMKEYMNEMKRVQEAKEEERNKDRREKQRQRIMEKKLKEAGEEGAADAGEDNDDNARGNGKKADEADSTLHAVKQTTPKPSHFMPPLAFMIDHCIQITKDRHKSLTSTVLEYKAKRREIPASELLGEARVRADAFRGAEETPGASTSAISAAVPNKSQKRSEETTGMQDKANDEGAATPATALTPSSSSNEDESDEE
jgi:hypothetical protein